MLSHGALLSNILPVFADTLTTFYDFLTTPLKDVFSEWSILFSVITTLLEKLGASGWWTDFLDMQIGVFLFGAGLITVLIVNLIKWFLPII